jgi:hypothetical protein
MFGYAFAKATTIDEAEALVNNKGLEILMGAWQYFDEVADDWRFCIIKEANPDSVTVIKTDAFGYQDANMPELVRLDNPATSLRK